MKTAQDIKLESEIAAPILELLRAVIDGEFDEVPNGDMQGLVEAMAAGIITTIKERL